MRSISCGAAGGQFNLRAEGSFSKGLGGVRAIISISAKSAASLVRMSGFRRRSCFGIGRCDANCRGASRGRSGRSKSSLMRRFRSSIRIFDRGRRMEKGRAPMEGFELIRKSYKNIGSERWVVPEVPKGKPIWYQLRVERMGHLWAWYQASRCTDKVKLKYFSEYFFGAKPPVRLVPVEPAQVERNQGVSTMLRFIRKFDAGVYDNISTSPNVERLHLHRYATRSRSESIRSDLKRKRSP
jgi:hypothetical protein